MPTSPSPDPRIAQVLTFWFGAAEPSDASALDYAHQHQRVIARFGRSSVAKNRSEKSL